MKEKLRIVFANMKESYKAVFIIFLFVAVAQGILFRFMDFRYFVNVFIARILSGIPFMEAVGSPLIRIIAYVLAILLLNFILYTRFFGKEITLNGSEPKSSQFIASRLVVSFLTLTFTVVLVLELLRAILVSIGQTISPYVGESLAGTLQFYTTAIYVFGIFYFIKTGVGIGSLIKSTTRFIFSKSSAMLLAVLLLINIVYQTINQMTVNYFYMKAASLFEDGGLISFFDAISTAQFPMWYHLLVLAVNALIIFFVYAYISSDFKEKKSV